MFKKDQYFFQELEWMTVRREQTNRITKVTMDNGWAYRQMTGKNS